MTYQLLWGQRAAAGDGPGLAITSVNVGNKDARARRGPPMPSPDWRGGHHVPAAGAGTLGSGNGRSWSLSRSVPMTSLWREGAPPAPPQVRVV